MKGTMGKPPSERIAQGRAEIDAYTLSLQAMLVLEKIFGDVVRAKVRVGPRMQTSDGSEVTPDMVFEVPSGHFAGYRAVNEVKSQYPPPGHSRRKLARQIRQYGDIESGWSARRPAAAAGPGRRATYDLMLTVPMGHAGDYIDNLPGDLRAAGAPVAREICILGFERDPQRADRLRAKKVHGRLSVPEIDELLAEGSTHVAYGMLGKLSTVKFYDSNPPVPYMMSILWSVVFPSIIHAKKRKEMEQGRTVEIRVGEGRICALVSKLAPPSNPHCIKSAWVTAALDKLVDVKLARKVGDGEYVIHYRQGESHVLDWLIGLVDSARAGAGRQGDTGAGDSAALDQFVGGRGA